MTIRELYRKVITRLHPAPKPPQASHVDPALEDLSYPPTRVGIVGTGAIAAAMARTLSGMQSCVAAAVASRSLDKARGFADQWHIAKAYGSYADLMADPDIDLVYIATPHTAHYDCARLAIDHGKPCLVEKPFTTDRASALDLLQRASEQGTFVAEAMWTRTLPVVETLRQQLAAGLIGRPTEATIEIGWDMRSNQRIVSPALGGGALLDVGIYGIHLSRLLFGPWAEFSSRCERHATGVDIEDQIEATCCPPSAQVSAGASQAGMEASHGTDDTPPSAPSISTGPSIDQAAGPDPAPEPQASARQPMVKVHITASAKRLTHRVVIKGDDGSVETDYAINPYQLKVYDRRHRLTQTIVRPLQFMGYEYELLACRAALHAGQPECPALPHAETLEALRTVDELMLQWGIKTPHSPA